MDAGRTLTDTHNTTQHNPHTTTQMFGEGVHPDIDRLFETRLGPFLSQKVRVREREGCTVQSVAVPSASLHMRPHHIIAARLALTTDTQRTHTHSLVCTCVFVPHTHWTGGHTPQAYAFWSTRLWYFKTGLYYQGGMVRSDVCACVTSWPKRAETRGQLRERLD